MDAESVRDDDVEGNEPRTAVAPVFKRTEEDRAGTALFMPKAVKRPAPDNDRRNDYGDGVSAFPKRPRIDRERANQHRETDLGYDPNFVLNTLIVDDESQLKSSGEIDSDRKLATLRKRYLRNSQKRKGTRWSKNSISASAYANLASQKAHRFRADAANRCETLETSVVGGDEKDNGKDHREEDRSRGYDFSSASTSNGYRGCQDEGAHPKAHPDSSKATSSSSSTLFAKAVLLKLLLGKMNQTREYEMQCPGCGKTEFYVELDGKRFLSKSRKEDGFFRSKVDDSELLFQAGALERSRLDDLLFRRSVISCKNSIETSNGRRDVCSAPSFDVENGTTLATNVFAFYFLNPTRISSEGGKIRLYGHFFAELIRRHLLKYRSSVGREGNNGDVTPPPPRPRPWCDRDRLLSRVVSTYKKNLSQVEARIVEDRDDDLADVLSSKDLAEGWSSALVRLVDGLSISKVRGDRGNRAAKSSTEERYAEINERINGESERSDSSEARLAAHLRTASLLCDYSRIEIEELLSDPRRSNPNEEETAPEEKTTTTAVRRLCYACHKNSAFLAAAVPRSLSSPAMVRFDRSQNFVRKTVARCETSPSCVEFLQMTYSDRLQLLGSLARVLIDVWTSDLRGGGPPVLHRKKNGKVDDSDDGEEEELARLPERVFLRIAEELPKMHWCLAVGLLRVATLFGEYLTPAEADILCSLGGAFSVSEVRASAYRSRSVLKSEDRSDRVKSLLMDKYGTMPGQRGSSLHFGKDNNWSGCEPGEVEYFSELGVLDLQPVHYLSSADTSVKISNACISTG